jgi:hypothetical protein
VVKGWRKWPLWWSKAPCSQQHSSYSLLNE